MKERIAQLRAMGIRTIMVTGDNPLTAQAIATEAGVGPVPGTTAPVATARDAIVAAAPGDVIEVCPGDYNEFIVVTTADLTINGAKAGVPAGPAAAPAGSRCRP